MINRHATMVQLAAPPRRLVDRARIEGLRWRRRSELERLYRDIVGSWDQAAFIATFRDLWDPFESTGDAKYLNLKPHVVRAIESYLGRDLFAGDAPKQVLDIGCGMGYFLAVCRHHGHSVVGIDLDTSTFYNRSIEVLDIPRVVHRVEPDDAFPDLGRTFDVITAFEVCFNGHWADAYWGEDEWATYLPHLIDQLRPGGVALLQFNQEHTSGARFPPCLPGLINREPRLEARFAREFVRLTRVG